MVEGKNRFRGLRTKGYGFGISPTPGMLVLNMDPITELAQSIAPFSGRTFDFGTHNIQAFRMRGGMAFAGLGNGFRIGGAGLSGDRQFVSDTYSGDSVVVLKTSVSYGGVLLEKAFVHNRMNFLVGGIVGGGSLKVQAAKGEKKSVFWFDNPYDIEDAFSNSSIDAGFLLAELHGGFTYTIFPLMHIGLDVSGAAFVSPDGFSSSGIPYTTNFVTVNLGFKLHIVFGNLG
jgi:hypothetical protein